MKDYFTLMFRFALVLHALTQPPSMSAGTEPAGPRGGKVREIRATWMRGGTSKCWVFRSEDLHVPGLTRDEVLLRVFGSPDHRQVDGVGGGSSTTSKAVILNPSDDPDVDVD